jgi:anti-sigma factor RsiW
MSCPELPRTQAYLDGALDSAASREAEAHLETCEECQAMATAAAELSDALRTSATHHRASPQLRASVYRMLEVEIAPRRNPVRRSFWFGAFGVAGVTALAASLSLFLILPPSAATLADAVTDAHTGALMRGQIFEVASSNHHTVKPWFAGRVAVSPPVVDFAKQGFVLTGGRIDDIAGSRAAVVTYRHGAHEVDLFVWADRGSRLPGETMRHGYRAIFWKNGDLNFAAVSDTESAELKKFIALVHAAPE